MAVLSLDVSIEDRHVAAAANIAATKVNHQFVKEVSQSGTATSVTQVIHKAYAAGTLVAFSAGSVAACIGAATVVVDLKKNGTTVLSATITLDSGNSAYVAEAATLSVTSYVAGDVFTIVTTAAAGGGTLASGFYADAVFREPAA